MTASDAEEVIGWFEGLLDTLESMQYAAPEQQEFWFGELRDMIHEAIGIVEEMQNEC